MGGYEESKQGSSPTSIEHYFYKSSKKYKKIILFGLDF